MASDKDLEVVLENMPAAAIRCDRATRLLWANSLYGRWHQRPVQDMLGRPLADILGERQMEEIRPHVERVLKGEEVRFERVAHFRGLGRRWFYYAPPFHVHYFTAATIRRLLAAAGFGDVRVRPIRKPLTLDYAAAAAAHLMPALGPAARVAAALVPVSLRSRPLLLPVGEMLVTARAAGRG